jgi:two-component system sensor histidine kinase UhpB
MIDEPWIKDLLEEKPARTLERIYNDTQPSKQQLAALEAYTEKIRRLERKRIAHDLHDDLGGHLSALKMMLSHVWKTLPQTTDLANQYAYLNRLLDTCIDSIHTISADLIPGVIEAGLPSALEYLAAELERQTQIPCEFRCNLHSTDIDKKIAAMLFRVAQEACTNIRKHANATGAELHLYSSASEVQLEIIDNGCGIPEQLSHSSQSFGLQSMRERSAEFGGRLVIASRQGKGTLLSVRVPYFSCVNA